MSPSNNSKKDAIDSFKKEKHYIKRNIIKLGSSLAVTFPKDFFKSFKDKDNEDDNFKNINVHAYKIDPNSILIRKHKAESEMQILDIDVSQFPIELLENLLASSRKLNVNQVNIFYDDDDYEKCLEIVNKFGPPIHSENKMTIDLSRIYKEYKFRDQIQGMVKNFSKIVENIMDDRPVDVKTKRSIDTYLNSINASFNEALRVLIMRLKNYYLWNDDDAEKSAGITNNINTLGNRVLISHIKSISNGASNLFFYKDTKEIQKFKKIISKFPALLKEETELILSVDIEDKIHDINTLREKIESEYNQFKGLIPDKTKDYSVNDEIINNLIDFMFSAFFDILNIILTRWIEHSVVVD